MAQLLIVEDDQALRIAMVRALSRDHVVRSVGAALDGLREIRSAPDLDLVVLDLGLPDLDGTQTLQLIRSTSTVPVLIATARDDESEISRLLRDGADDYIVKPFSEEHLGARVQAILRRTSPSDAPTVLTVEDLVIDLGRRTVHLDGEELELTRREFDMLSYLAERPGTVVAKDELLTQVWRDSYLDSQTIDVHLSALRRKLGESAAHPRYLHTVRGVGVRLDPSPGDPSP